MTNALSQNRSREASLEEIAEIRSLGDLASNMGDGMQTLKPSNVARPLSTFAAEAGVDMPQYLTEVDAVAEQFIDWQLGRKSMQKPEAQARWSAQSALDDVALFIRRKTWQRKVAEQHVVNEVALMLAVTSELHKKYRSDVHEALNHAAKHNDAVKELGQEMRDQLDDVVRERLHETTRMIAGAALATVPKLQAVLMQNVERIEHTVDGNHEK